MLGFASNVVITKAEKRLGVTLDYTRQIARTSFALLLRYGKIFDMIDPRKHTTPEAYATARLRGALAADCGTCVRAEINLARSGGLSDQLIGDILLGDIEVLPSNLQPVRRLADAVCRDRTDNPAAREDILNIYGHAALIELSYAMNGAAMLPGIKRAMGYATACDATVFQELKFKQEYSNA